MVRVRLCSVVVAVAGLSLVVLPASASAEPLCTDSWTGAAEGSWQTASNWSKEEVPGSSDVVCIGSGKTVQVTGGSNQASSVQGEGVLAISGGTLELVAGLETSSIGGLAVSGGTLSLAGALDVTNSFSVVGTPTITGSGKLVVGSSVSGSIGTGSTCSVHPTLSGVTLVNEGSLTFGASGGVDAGAIMMEEGAELDNKGTFNDESYDNSCGYGVNIYYYSFYSGGGSTSIVNTGTFDTSAGFITKIGVPFVNKGAVRAQDGWVGFDDGGSGSAGTWGAASGAALRFEGGSFSLSGDTLAGPGEVNFASASVTASGVATSGGPDVTLSGGTLTIPEGSTMSDSSGTFTIVGTPTIDGPGRLVVGSSVSGTFGSGSSCSVHPTLSGVTFVNEGSLMFGTSGGVDAGAIMMEEGAEFDNKGTFNDESYDNSCGYGVNIYYYSFYSGGGATSIVNTGTFDTSAGFITKVGVPFVNEGAVRAQDGWVGFDDGGSGSAGTWGAASGAALRFEGGSFSLDGDTLSGPGEVNFASASVTASGVDTTGGPDVTVSGGTLTIPEGSTMSDTSGTFTMTGTPTITGSGKLVVGPSVSGSIGTSSSCSAHPTLNGVTFVNEGSLTFGASGGVNAGAIMMEEGAELDNKGTFNDESYDNSCGYGVNIYYYSFYSGGGSASIVNTGTFDASDGYIIKIYVPFSNQGIVEEKTGALDFEDGGVAEHVATGEWLTQSGASLILGTGTFLVSEEADLSAVTIGGGATVERVPAAGPPHGHLYPYPYASHTITLAGEGKNVGTGFSSASIELTPAGSEEWKTLCGPLTPSLVNEFGCSWDTASGSYPDGLYKARAQLSDASEPPNTGPTPSITVLVDNTAPTGSVAPPAYIGGASATVGGSAKDSGSGVQSWQLQIAPEGSSEWTNACPAQTSPASGETYQCSVNTTGLTEGAHILRAIVTDKAGNEYTTSTASTTVDNTPPAVSLEEVSEGLYVKGTISLKGTASDSISGVASWTPEIAPEGSTSWTDACAPQTTPISGSTYGCSMSTTGYSDGKYQIRARAENNATDTHITSAQTATIDNTPPTGSLDALERTTKGTLTVKGPASDPEAGVATWQLEIRSTASSEWHSACLAQSVPIEGDEYGCLLDTTSLTDGSYQLHAVITDNAGNLYTTHPVTTRVHNGEEVEEGPDPSCTDTWTGDAGDGSWQTAGNWSTSSVPTSTTRACIPSGATATISYSNTTVGSITGEGDIAVVSGTLELADSSTVSEIGGLTLNGTTLTGSGTLEIYGALTTTGRATVNGSEEIVVESGATGTIDSESCTTLTLNGTAITNNGTLTLGASGGQAGTLGMENGARLDNAGTFNVDSYRSNCISYVDEDSIQNNGGFASSVTNTGTLNVDVGSGNNGSVGVPFNTEGTVHVQSGTFALGAGGTATAGTWTSEAGTTVNITNDTYSLYEAGASGASFSVSWGTLSVPSGSSTVGGLTMAGGAVEVVGTLKVNSSLSTTGGTIDGSGKLVVEATATGLIGSDSCSALTLNKTTLVNDGTLTLGVTGSEAGQLAMENGANLENDGTFNADSYMSDCLGYLGYDSIRDSGGTTLPVTNTGVFNVDVGSGNSAIVSLPFNSEGTVHVQSGTLALRDGGTSDGTWTSTGGGPAVILEGPTYSLINADASGGGFSIEYGTLSVPSGTSSVGALSVGNGTVSITGELEVTSSFVGGSDGSPAIDGPGTLVVGSAATGTIDKDACSSGGGNFLLSEIDFVNHGTITLGVPGGGPNGDIVLANGAQIQNSGTFNVNSWSNGEGTCSNCYYSIALGSGGTPTITNTGTFDADVGSGNTAKIGVPFENEGHVKGLSGDLKFDDGGIAEEASAGSWEVDGGAIILSNGTFIFIDGSDQSGVQIEGAHIVWIARGLNGSLNSIPQYVSGDIVLSGSGEGGLAGPFDSASIEIKPGEAGTWSTLCGPLTPGLTSTFECTWETASGSYTDGYYELRAKLTSGSSPPETVTTPTMSVLVDNTAPTGAIVAPPSHGLDGTYEITGTASDSGSGVESWQAQIAPEGSSEWANACPAQTSQSFEGEYGCALATSKYTNGSYSLRAVVTDRAGNTYTTSTVALHIDNEAVTGTLESIPAAIGGTVEVEGTASVKSGSVESWQVQLAAADSSSWSSACPAQTTPVSGSTYSCNLETSGLAEGSYSVRVIVTGSEGETYTTATQTTIVDNTPPVGFLYPWSGSVSGDFEIQGYAEDSGSGVAEWKLQIASAGSESWHEACLPQTMPAFGDVYGCLVEAGELENGEYELRAILLDAVGNSYTTATIPITIDNVSPSSSTAPSISGQFVVGHTLSASNGTWAGAGPIKYTYQWKRCNSSGESCANITGATTNTYTLSGEDTGETVTVAVTASNAAGETSATATPTTVVLADTLGNITEPRISGSPQVGSVMTADPGEWRGAQPIAFSYQWQRCNSKGESCTDISGASSQAYTATESDLSDTLLVEVTASNTEGSASATSTASEVVTSASGSGIRYLYDNAGRLHVLDDPSQGAAVYEWDADGNLTSIKRYPDSAVAVLAITPSHAPAGSRVDITGTGFSAEKADDAVTFNGTAASVEEADTTDLIVTVPEGATEGPVTVTVGGKSSESPTSFAPHVKLLAPGHGTAPVVSLASLTPTSPANASPAAATPPTRTGKTAAKKAAKKASSCAHRARAHKCKTTSRHANARRTHKRSRRIVRTKRCPQSHLVKSRARATDCAERTARKGAHARHRSNPRVTFSPVLRSASSRPAATPSTPAPAQQNPPGMVVPTNYKSPYHARWDPTASNRKDEDWTTGRSPSPWASLRPLQARHGTTGLSGQALVIDGTPLANVTLSIQGTSKQTKTDSTGRFVLDGLPAGHQVLIIDGESADHGSRRYGRFTVGVEVTYGKVTPLGYTVWMTPLDPDGNHTIHEPLKHEAVLTNTRIPGLEVKLPAGTVIRSSTGALVHNVNLTAVPVDRPPFPLPLFATGVPTYFTVQPGGAYLSKGAQIVYPNWGHVPAGQRVDFWNYDPTDKGWYVYGKGTVSANGQQVIPDPNIHVWEFTGAMITTEREAPETAPTNGAETNAGDPVDLASGLFVYKHTDLQVPDSLMSIALTRTYRPGDSNAYSFGIGMQSTFDIHLWSNEDYKTAYLVLPDGDKIKFVRTSPGESYREAVYGAVGTPGEWEGSTIEWSESEDGWRLR